jgi:hypothetical protein
MSLFTSVHEKAVVSGQSYCRNGHGRLSRLPRIPEVLRSNLRSATDILIYFSLSTTKYVDFSFKLVTTASVSTLSSSSTGHTTTFRTRV